ncbi:hypothetical protein SDC9_94764 [bioreactor metagenome]|uniref:Uncharacterized protein n=1 Tax=bioreactor metagenome TaxID=1076179 RepID=A0A645AB35_9ZZZZ
MNGVSVQTNRKVVGIVKLNEAVRSRDSAGRSACFTDAAAVDLGDEQLGGLLQRRSRQGKAGQQAEHHTKAQQQGYQSGFLARHKILLQICVLFD